MRVVILGARQAVAPLSTIELQKGNTPSMSCWRKRLFLATAQISADAAEYFDLPAAAL
jgi:K+ transporter